MEDLKRLSAESSVELWFRLPQDHSVAAVAGGLSSVVEVAEDGRIGTMASKDAGATSRIDEKRTPAGAEKELQEHRSGDASSIWAPLRIKVEPPPSNIASTIEAARGARNHHGGTNSNGEQA
eukprot:GSA120T00000981001.1